MLLNVVFAYLVYGSGALRPGDGRSNEPRAWRSATSRLPSEDRGAQPHAGSPPGGSHVAAARSARRSRPRCCGGARPQAAQGLRAWWCSAPSRRAARPSARARCAARIAFLPADGGLISNLNGWENIALPLGLPRAAPHARARAARCYALLEDLRRGRARAARQAAGGDDALREEARRPMSRMMLARPRLVLAEIRGTGLGAGERRRAARFAAAYLARLPGRHLRAAGGGADETE